MNKQEIIRLIIIGSVGLLLVIVFSTGLYMYTQSLKPAKATPVDTNNINNSKNIEYVKPKLSAPLQPGVPGPAPVPVVKDK